MKCPVCNINEVVPLKEGTIPDCVECQVVSSDAAELEYEGHYVQDEQWVPLEIWDDYYYPYDEGLDLD